MISFDRTKISFSLLLVETVDGRFVLSNKSWLIILFEYLSIW